MTLVVGFTGTRQGPTPAQHKSMGWFLSRLPIGRFVHGGAKGCDTLAHNVVRNSRPPIPIDVYPAPFDTGSVVWAARIVKNPLTVIHEVAPPLERNRVIVSRIDGLVAVPATDVEEIRSGTWATVRYARKIGCPVILILKDGRIVRDGEP